MTATLLPSVDVLIHVAEPLKFMVEELHAGRAPANVMKFMGEKAGIVEPSLQIRNTVDKAKAPSSGLARFHRFRIDIAKRTIQPGETVSETPSFTMKVLPALSSLFLTERRSWEFFMSSHDQRRVKIP